MHEAVFMASKVNQDIFGLNYRSLDLEGLFLQGIYDKFPFGISTEQRIGARIDARDVR